MSENVPGAPAGADTASTDTADTADTAGADTARVEAAAQETVVEGNPVVALLRSSAGRNIGLVVALGHPLRRRRASPRATGSPPPTTCSPSCGWPRRSAWSASA